MKYIIVLLFISVSNIYFSQIRYYAQGFESSTNACPNNWTYTGGNRNNQHARTGSYSARVGRSGESNTLTFDAIDISLLSNAILSFNHSVLNGSGPGMDTREGALFMISLNGNPYTIISGVSGFGDHNYSWNATGGTTSSSSGCNTYQTPNPFVYAIPSGTSTISLRVISIGRNSSNCSSFNSVMSSGTASNFDRTDEGIYIDDVEIWADGPSVLAPITVCENEAFSVGVTNTNTAMTYNWSGPNNYSSILQNPQVTLAASASMSGTYSTIISFASCPIVTLNQTVNVSAGPNLSISGSLSFCTGSSTTLSASGGTNYQWSNGLGNNSTAQITTAGTYTVIATNGGTCTAQETITVSETSSIVNNTNVSECFSYIWPINNQTYTASGNYTFVNGCITENLNLTITGSTQNTTDLTVCDSYTWPLNGLTYTSSGTYFTTVGCQTELLNLTITPSSSNTTTNINACDSFTWPINNQTYTASGNYTFVNGCVTEVLNLTISNSVTNTTTITECSSYTWPLNNQTYTSSGTYTVVNGCLTEILLLTISGVTQNTTNQTACDSYTWSENGVTYFNSGVYSFITGCNTKILNLIISQENTNTTVANACNSYTWSQNNLTYTTSGTYTFVNGCNTEILELTIESNPILTFDNPTVCQGQATTLTVTSNQVGTTFIWNDGQTTASITASPSITTSYNVLGTNQYGCFTTGIGIINVTPSPQLIYQDTSICLGQTATISVSPITNGGTYLWNTGATSSSIVVNPTQSTTYSVQYTLNACQSSIAIIDVTVAPPFILVANNPTICSGNSALITATSSIPGGIFTWSDGSNNPSAYFSPISDTIVTFSYSLNGCTSTETALISVLELPNISISPSLTEGCTPLNIDFSTPFIESTQCTWQIDGQTVSSTCGSLNYTFYNSNCYDISLSVVGTNGCINTASYTDLVCVYPNPVANFYFDEFANYQTSATVGFTNTSQNSFQNWWNFGDGNFTTNENTPIHNFFFENDASFNVELVVESEYGCRDSIIKTVSFKEELYVYVPNTFTPDGSGFNEVWKPIFSTIVDQGSYECFVFNRFGEQLFYTQNFNEGWDGSYNGNKIQDGTYTYYIEYSELGVAKSTILNGHINVLR